MQSTDKRALPPVRPAVDEWGMYDPEQAGLAALFERLDARRAAEPDAQAMAASMRDASRLLDAKPKRNEVL